MNEDIHNYSNTGNSVEKKEDTSPNPFKDSKVVFTVSEAGSEKRPVDTYSREEIGEHVAKFMGKCAALKINPDVNAILNYLYEKKKPYSDETFIPLSTVLKLLQSGHGSPELIMEALSYSIELEKNAIALLRKIKFVDHEIKDEFEALRETLKNVV